MPFDPVAFMAATKTISGAFTWSVDGADLVMVAYLDIDGVTVQGAQLRCLAKILNPNLDIMVQLEHEEGRLRQLARIDWKRFHSHNNHGRGPEEWRYREFDDSHHHPFALNWLVAEQRMLAGNLPIAHPLAADPADYAALLEFVGQEFRIDNMVEAPVPSWEPILGG